MIKIEPQPLHEMFVKAIKQVFLDMLEAKIELSHSDLLVSCEPIDRPQLGVVGDVRGIQMDFTGDFDGELFFYYDYAAANELTRAFFKLNDVEMEDKD